MDELTDKIKETRLLMDIGGLIQTMAYDITEITYHVSDRPVRLVFKTKDGSSYMMLLIKDSSDGSPLS